MMTLVVEQDINHELSDSALSSCVNTIFMKNQNKILQPEPRFLSHKMLG